MWCEYCITFLYKIKKTVRLSNSTKNVSGTPKRLKAHMICHINRVRMILERYDFVRDNTERILSHEINHFHRT